MIACLAYHDIAAYKPAPHEGSATSAHGADNTEDLADLAVEP
ncbi:hypothetical protein [Labrys sp. KNU-23]|nr:hypothetical protein [Labrys sp. KNU-23]